ncbi:Glycosyltransferase, DXD sugar-binding motif [Phaffia rhodozyma]|uniref:Glycosyltransferase, DXD sugar-binding motif n=1 Tax=Phaffia rhodozyma TaxID=264483 RepID=A0A0F7SSD3_PHARH|nr:Glycosyltransferase, DXD sugar-binding motif [Phaffia rhodozyma]
MLTISSFFESESSCSLKDRMSHLFGRSQSGLHHHQKARRSPLPSFSSSSSNAAINEKLYQYNPDLHTASSSYWTTVLVPLPFGKQPRKFRLSIPVPPRLYLRISRTSYIRAKLLVLALGCLVFFVWLLGSGKKKNDGDDGGGQGDGGWPNPFKDPDTVVISKEEIKAVWEWEIISGHWPSRRSVPQSNLQSGYVNPSLPHSPPPVSSNSPSHYFQGSGHDRTYVNLTVPTDPRTDGGFDYPKRPVTGSVADLDIIMKECDLSKGAYVRDCLEVLRVGGNLDGRRVKRGDLSPWSYVFTEQPSTSVPSNIRTQEADQRSRLVLGLGPATSLDQDSLKTKPETPKPKLNLPTPYPARSSAATPSQPCDPNRPRLFHIFWAGPFTDKPYMAILSFLFTQNLGLDLPQSQWSKQTNPPVCRPQFLVWINPGHAASVPNPAAKREMYEALATNPWSAPFLHSRFKDVVKFKMWNTTEQLDGVPELKDHWRSMPILNSGGFQFTPPAKEDSEVGDEVDADAMLSDEELLAGIVADLADAAGGDQKPKPPKPAKIPKVSLGASEKDYDKLSTVLSDMVRFVLLHRFGGIYLDADNILLRDWEELWNWKGAFAYRWSYHDKYNTAIIKMHKKSALTSFLFKTALENKMDFHPMTISRYLEDAGLSPLLYRLPDALFDSAWLNMEKYQRERPPFPYFPEFKKFFVGDKQLTAEPQPAGFDAFFRGAFCYHYHNNWWLPFDPARNWPDLGQKFIRGERLLRDAIFASKKPSKPLAVKDTPEEESNPSGVAINNRAVEPVDTSLPENAVERVKRPVSTGGTGKKGEWADKIEDDERDLAWAAIMKRTFEAYIRGEAPNMYGEWLKWE